LTAFTLADRFPIPPGVWGVTGALFGWFVVGFLLYSAIFGTAGALAARVEDLQNRRACCRSSRSAP
jgi:hypothetical protein